MIIHTKAPRIIGAYAITVYPFTLIDMRRANGGVLTREIIHYEEQRKWFRRGLGIGLVVWFFLYLLFLPVGWNPLRQRTETKALREQGFDDAEIADILKHKYYLWLAK